MITLFRRLTLWLGLIGIGALAHFILTTTAPVPMPPPPVAPPSKPFADSIGASGIVEALRENTNVGVAVPALVSEVPVQVWQRVEKGDVLLRLDDRELRAQLVSLRAEEALREAELRRAAHQRDRMKKLADGRLVAVEDMEKREDELSIARAAVEKARASIAQMEQLLDRFTIRAPQAGTVLQVNVRVGEYASPAASSPPLVLGSTDELQVRADVDEQIAVRVQPGAKAIAYRKGAANDPIALEFVRIEPFIIPKKNLTGSSVERVDTRVLQVIYRFPNPTARKAYVGQQVDIFIEELPPAS